MLQLNFYNDRTATPETGFANYLVTVSIDYHVVARERVEHHCKADGWRELVRRLVFDSSKEPSDR